MPPPHSTMTMAFFCSAAPCNVCLSLALFFLALLQFRVACPGWVEPGAYLSDTSSKRWARTNPTRRSRPSAQGLLQKPPDNHLATLLCMLEALCRCWSTLRCAEVPLLCLHKKDAKPNLRLPGLSPTRELPVVEAASTCNQRSGLCHIRPHAYWIQALALACSRVAIAATWPLPQGPKLTACFPNICSMFLDMLFAAATSVSRSRIGPTASRRKHHHPAHHCWRSGAVSTLRRVRRWGTGALSMARTKQKALRCRARNGP